MWSRLGGLASWAVEQGRGDAMHAACTWSWDAEVIMLWEGEAGTGLWHGEGGTHAAWGSSPLAPGGLPRQDPAVTR